MKKKYWLFLSLVVFLLAGCGDVEVETGPYAEAGPVEVSLSVNTQGQVKIGGAYSQSLVKAGPLDIGWRGGC